MNIRSLIRQVRIVSPKLAVKKFLDKKKIRKLDLQSEQTDFLYSTYKEYPLIGNYNFIINAPDYEILVKYRTDIFKSADLICEHYFDLLGSGLVKIAHGEKYSGIDGKLYEHGKFVNLLKFTELLNESNRIESKKLLHLLSSTYNLIDWQVDFRSGYRWYDHLRHNKISYGKIDGADIKMPWELGRMQHLIVLAYSVVISVYENETEKKNKYLLEYQNQIIDFAASNPPRYGTQWMTAMDIGIRAVNLAASFSILESSGIKFSKQFIEIFNNTVYTHYWHIIDNLEWSSSMRGNHFLSNISAVLFLSAFLPSQTEVNLNIKVFISLFEKELEYQFNKDGSNFEASVSYHKFAVEMSALSLWSLFSLDEDRLNDVFASALPSKFSKQNIPINKINHFSLNEGKLILSDLILDKFYKIYDFMLSASYSNMPFQFGDNDSGYMLKLSPIFINDVLNEYPIPKKHFYPSVNCICPASAMLSGLLNFDINENIPRKSEIEHILTQELSEKSCNEKNTKSIAKRFDNFGIYICTKNDITIAVRAGGIGQNGKGGHAHNDALSFELYAKGIPLIVDPGTYLYTSNHAERNKYRSAWSHNALAINGKEPNDWYNNDKDDLFWMNGDKAKAKAISFDENAFIGSHKGYGEIYTRSIFFEEKSISGNDILNLPNIEKNLLFHLAPGSAFRIISNRQAKAVCGDVSFVLNCDDGEIVNENYLYSPSYGIRQYASLIRVVYKGNEINWKIELV